MDPLERRVAERMTLEARELRAAQMVLGKRRQTLAKDAAKAMTAVKKMFDVLGDGGRPTAVVARAGMNGIKTLTYAAREMTKINEQADENAAALARLDDSDERERRLKVARELGGGEAPLSGLEALELALIRRGKATHISDLTGDVLESGVVKITGKTPEQTMSAYLAKAVGKPDAKFVRVAPGVFDLASRAKATATTS